jgi:DNA polymerase-1
MPKPLVLIDGSSYLYRAFHALPPLTNSRGEPTGAIYGVLNMIRKLLMDYDPELIAVIFDPKGKTFRNDLYPQYKAHRPPAPVELKAQVQPLFDIIKAMGLPLLVIEGVEADDVIATLATQATALQIPVLISTGDKDMAQLVNEHVTLINTMSGTVLDREGVIKKFGVPPEAIVDYLTLIGDTIDNIPGVAKVGPKTAAKWLSDYGSLAAIMQRAHEISGKIGDNLRSSLAQLPLSQELVTLRRDVALPLTPQTLNKNAVDQTVLLELFKRLEFKGLLSELLQDENLHPATPVVYDTIFTLTEFTEWLQRLEKAPFFAFDTETTSLNALQAELVGVSFSVAGNAAAYIPLTHDYLGAPEQLSRAVVLERLKPLLENPQKIIIGQNLKYDINVLAKYGIQFKAQLFDTMLESYILDSTSSRHNMDSLALKHLGKKTIRFEDIAGKGAKQLTFNQISIEEASPYAAEDADVTLQLHTTLWPQLQANVRLSEVFSQIEMPLVPVLADIERTGVMVNVALLNQHSRELAERLKQLEQEVYMSAGAVFNLGSPKQLQDILYDKLKLPVLSKTPTGVPSTAEAVLQELALSYPLPKLILEYRSLSKLKSTYTDSLPKQINPITGRIHTSYNQAVTATGRLSSTEPNLQNIPIRHEQGRRVRQAFIAPPGYKIISADYSQIELRIMAHLSQDPSLLHAFANELDIHRATAAEVFFLPLEKVSNEQRRSAKAINFGLIYGMSAFGLAKQLSIDRATAQQYMDVYFARYPGVQNYMRDTRTLARQQGYVETLMGRRLYVPDINASNQQRRNGAERAAINAPMQGTAADIIKLAMIKLHDRLQAFTGQAKMIMQVHDELVFEVAEDCVDILIPEIQTAMTQALSLSVPLAVHISVGNNWDEAH